MGAPILQPRSIILPAARVGTEAINDIVEHTSNEVGVRNLHEKIVHIYAQEVYVGAVPGGLWVWVELSPFPTTVSGAYWSAIGGGGGAIAPVAPLIIVPVGATTTITTAQIPWNNHSRWARVVAQMPVAGGGVLATDGWVVQLVFEGKGP